MAAQDIAQLAATLAKLQNEWIDLAFDEDEPAKLGPPATLSETARHAARFRQQLPPSYLHFLHTHNGWSGFSGEADLLSTTDYDEEWYANTRRIFGEALKKEGSPFDRYIPFIVGIGPRLAVFFDPATRDEQGEMEVVEFHDGEEQTRHAHFTAFLEDRIETYEALIDDERNGDDVP